MGKQVKHSFLYKNGLSIVLIAAMLLFLTAQFFTGWADHNHDLEEDHRPALSIGAYATSGHFISATFENWESEFLQMTIYVLLTVSLRQKGSAESKKLEGEEGADEEAVDKPPVAHPGAPWPVKKGGLVLKIYNNSLSLAFTFLFILSFWLHFCGSLRDRNDELLHKHQPQVTAGAYIADAHFWFESFQNWQSEFLAVASIVILSIWLRQKGSPESKPVDTPCDETGK